MDKCDILYAIKIDWNLTTRLFLFIRNSVTGQAVDCLYNLVPKHKFAKILEEQYEG